MDLLCPILVQTISKYISREETGFASLCTHQLFLHHDVLTITRTEAGWVNTPARFDEFAQVGDENKMSMSAQIPVQCVPGVDHAE
jgi:hypothetical protein